MSEFTAQEELDINYGWIGHEQRKSTLASLFDYLCERNAVAHNPVKGVKRSTIENTSEGRIPALGDLGDNQARQLLEAPARDGMEAKRDRAILATLLYHVLLREGLCKPRVQTYAKTGAASRTSEFPVKAARHAISRYTLALKASGHAGNETAALFRRAYTRKAIDPKR